MRVESGHYQANRPRGATDPRVLHLKIRVVLTHAMTADQARLLLHRAVESGIVPPGIELRWMDWAKGTSGAVREGRIYQAGLRAALRHFYGAMQQAGTRFEKVSEENVDD